MKTKTKKVKDIKYCALVIKFNSLIKQLQQYLTDDEISKIISLGLQEERKEIIDV